ncbi:MAG: CAP domain-containing protein [Thermodesulfobacteriota bacterium]
MLFLVNEARLEDRFCGDDFFPAAPPVTWDDRIADSALVHSIDMAENQYFNHIAPDGSNAGDRLIDEGYQPAAWGENILVGLENSSVVIQNWLDSPGHCDVIRTDLHELGVGMAGNYQGRSTLLDARHGHRESR